MSIPKPNFEGSYPIFYPNCGCHDKPNERKDCYFFEDVPDMGCHIPTCNYHEKLGYCPCESCDKYINRKEVFKVIKEYVDIGSD